MPRAPRLHQFASLALLAGAAACSVGCEPTQSVDPSQVRPAGSATTNEPGHSVKFDNNQSTTAPQGGDGATAPK